MRLVYMGKCLHLFIAAILSIGIIPIAHADDQGKAIRIGAIAILSGDGAAWGVNQQRGTLLAVEEINRAGGIGGRRLEVLYQDSPSGSPQKAVSAYRQLVDLKKVRFILGPSWQDEVMALAPLAARDGVFLISASYMPKPPANYFSVWIDAEVETDLMAEHIFRKYKRVAVMSSTQSWEALVAARFRETFEKLGGAIVSYEEPLSDANDVRVQVLRIAASKPEPVFISTYNHFAKFTRQLAVQHLKPALYGIEYDQTIIDNAANAAEGVIFIGPAQAHGEFVDKFRARWNAYPDIPAVQSYDAAKILARFLAEKGEDVNGAFDYFRNFRSYQGAAGLIERRNGKTVISTSLYQVKGGKIEKVEE
jgi:branched-chain amino acid transport system substrate-binding protein